MPEIHRMRGIGKVIGVGIIASFYVRGDAALPTPQGEIISPTPPNPQTEPSPTPTPRTAIDSDPNSLDNINSIKRLMLEKTLEFKYGIDIVTQLEAYNALGIDINALDESQIGQELPLRWRSDQLELLEEFLPNMPDNLIKPVDGKGFKVFVGSFGTDCGCGGVTYFDTGYIGLSNDTFNETYKEYAFSALVHEATHRFYFLNDHSALDAEVTRLMGDQDLLNNRLEKVRIRRLPEGSMAQDIIASLLSKGKHQNFLEGVAEISELYVKGHDVFVASLGPFLDGKGNDGIFRYPNAQSLYEYWKENIFDKMEYDQNQIPIHPASE